MASGPCKIISSGSIVVTTEEAVAVPVGLIMTMIIVIVIKLIISTFVVHD